MEERNDRDMQMQNSQPAISRRTLLKGLGAAGLMVLAAACAPGAAPGATTAGPAPTAAATIKKGGTLNWGEPADPISFDPHNRNNASGTVLKRMIYQSLTRHNPRTLAVEPSLATKWEYTNPREIVWTLREGVVFHNGQAFTADDAKWNIERMIDPKTASPFASWYAAIEKVEATSKTSLKMTLKNPDPVLPGKFGAMVVSSFAPAGSDPNALATKPIGTGPYKLTEFVLNDHVTMVKNGDYWDKSIPHIDTLAVKFVPQEDTRIAALRAGQMDFAIVNADSAKRLAGAPNIKFIRGTHGVFTVIKFHQRFKPFTDPRVRKAMDMATNKQEIIDKALGGAGVITGPIVAGWEDYGIPTNQLPYKTDIAGAKKLMADAGYANGFEVTGVTLPEGGDGFYNGLATAAEQWKQIGITVKLQPLPIGDWLVKNNTLDYDLLIGNRGFRGDPIDVLTPHYTKAGTDNAIGYTNPEVEQWVAQAIVEPDRVKRRDLYLQIQRKVLDDTPWIFLWAFVGDYAMQNYVMGYDHVAFDSYKDLMMTTWLNK